MAAETATNQAFGVTPTGGGLGAVVRGVDLARLDDSAFAAIHQAWLDHALLVFPGQSLTDDDLIGFSRRFGDLDLAPVQETGRRFVDGYPELYVVSNVVVNGEPIGSLGSGELVWHTDMSYLAEPPKASMLYALEVPPAGGDTSFCSMYAALDDLPADLRARIEGRLCKHDGTYNSGGYVRQGVTATDDPTQAPGTPHPVICTHPETGRRMLYLGRRKNGWLVGLPLAESDALLDEIWAHVGLPAGTYTHRWTAGDLVLWDNRCTMHRREPFDGAARRVMHRTQIKGESRPAA